MPLPTVTIQPTNDPELLRVSFAYSSAIVARLRLVPSARWALNSWHVPKADLEITCKALNPAPVQLLGGLERAPIELARLPLDPAKLSRALESIDSYQFKTHPFDHQRTAMALAIQASAFALLMEMGTGKTKAAIDILSFWIGAGVVGGALIISPKCVLEMWPREIETHSPCESIRSAILRGGTKEKLTALREASGAQVVVTNYHALLGIEDQLARLVVERRFAIVLDESTAIKSHKSQISKAAYRLGGLTHFKLILTGTPITQSPLDAFAQFRFLSPTIIGHQRFTSFKNEYAVTGGFRGKEVVDYKNIDRLGARIAPYSFRVLKADCLDLPEKTYQVLPVEFGTEQRKAYTILRDESIVEIEGRFVATPVVLTKLLRLSQIASGFLPLHDEHGNQVDVKKFETPKIDAACELIEQAITEGQKVIVWCRFIWEIEQIASRLADLGTGAVYYHGTVSDEKRQKAVDSFQTDASVKVFVGQIQTGGMGITLTAATVVIYLSNSFTLSDRLQSEDRAHRIGQTKKVTYYDLVVKGSVDRYILRALSRKKDLADLVTGDNIREVLSDGNEVEN